MTGLELRTGKIPQRSSDLDPEVIVRPVVSLDGKAATSDNGNDVPLPKSER